MYTVYQEKRVHVCRPTRNMYVFRLLQWRTEDGRLFHHFGAPAANCIIIITCRSPRATGACIKRNAQLLELLRCGLMETLDRA